MEGRAVLQDLIPTVGQLEHVYVSIKGWIIDPDVYGLLDGPGDLVYLSTHYDAITRGVTMFIDGGGDPDMFLEPFP